MTTDLDAATNDPPQDRLDTFTVSDPATIRALAEALVFKGPARRTDGGKYTCFNFSNVRALGPGGKETEFTVLCGMLLEYGPRSRGRFPYEVDLPNRAFERALTQARPGRPSGVEEHEQDEP